MRLPSHADWRTRIPPDVALILRYLDTWLRLSAGALAENTCIGRDGYGDDEKLKHPPHDTSRAQTDASLAVSRYPTGETDMLKSVYVVDRWHMP